MFLSASQQRCGPNSLCVCTRRPPQQDLRPLAEATYREYFYQNEHKNYVAEEPDIGPLVLSIKQEGETLTAVRYVHTLLQHNWAVMSVATNIHFRVALFV